MIITNVQLAMRGTYTVQLRTEWGRGTNLSALLSVISARPMGTVVGWGRETNVPAGLSGVVALSAGNGYSLALRADGTVVGWGTSQYDVPDGLRDVVAVAAGEHHSLALKQDGTISGWGTDYNGQASPPGILGARAIAGGGSFSAAITAEGGAITWGNAYGGVLDVPLGLSNLIAVAAGSEHVLVLSGDGTIVGWASEAPPPLGVTNIIAVAAGHYHSMALRSDGTVLAFGWNYFGQTDVPPGLSNVVAIAANYGRCLVAKSDGTVAGWGLDDCGQTTPPPGLTNVFAVAAGTYHSLAIKETGCFILAQPKNTNALAGANIAFEVIATGVSDLTYQWRFDGNDILQATNSTLPVFNVQPTNAGAYTVLVTSARGSEESTTATLTLLSPPVFTTQPESQTVLRGSNVSFSISVTGTPPVNLRWQRNGANLTFATNASLLLSNVTATNAGDYRVRAQNAYGASTSVVATLIVNSPPEIVVTPAAQAAVAGSIVTFSVIAGGSSPFGYRWIKDDTALLNETASTLRLVNVQNSDAGNYSVTITNGFGAVTSAPVSLSVIPAAPTILAQPSSQTVRLGASISLSVTATGAGPLSYAWKLNGTDLSPAGFAPTLVISNMSLANQGEYRVRISSPFGTVLSGPAVLTLKVPGDVIAWGSNNLGQLTVPDDLTNTIAIAAGYNHSLALRADGSVVAWGDNGLGQCNVPSSATNIVALSAGSGHSLALRSNGTVLGWGATNSVYGEANPPASVTNAILVEAGDLHSLALLADGSVVGWGYNANGQASPPPAVTNVIALTVGFYHSLALLSDGTVVGWGSYYGEPNGLSNVAAIASSSTQFLALLSNGRIVSWGPANFGQLNYAGPTNASTISGGGLSQRSHFLAAVSNGTVAVWGDNPGGVYSPPSDLANVRAVASGVSHNLALVRAPLIMSYPQNQVVHVGDSLTFQVTATRAEGASYEWRLNNNIIPLATNSTLTLSNVQLTQAGAYIASVSNRFGFVATLPAQLTVVPDAPIFVQQPTDQMAMKGGVASFSVTAIGSGTLNYQWLFNGAAISGAKAASFTLSNILSQQAGQYSVIVGNEYGFAASSNAILTLLVNDLIIDNPQAVVLGPWVGSTAPSQFGSNSLQKTQGFGDALVRFSTAIPRSGDYQVYEWHSAPANRSISVPHQIVHANGSTVLNVNQVLNTGRWNLLGSYSFETGVGAQILINDGTPDPGHVVVADAIKLVYLKAPPAILTQPNSINAAWGADVVFSVSVAGTQPLGYQWRKNGIAIAGATADMLALSGIQQWDAGDYSVLVSNPDGLASSMPAALAVVSPSLSFRLSGEQLLLDWAGPCVLQTATSATGPYLDLIGSKAPYTNCVSSDTQRFFRLNCSGGNVAPKLEFHSSNRLLVLECWARPICKPPPILMAHLSTFLGYLLTSP